MPFYETVEQRLPIGLHHNGIWYDTAIVREMIAADNQAMTSAEAAQNTVKGITKLLSQVITGFRSSDNHEAKLDKVNVDIVRDMYIADRDMVLLALRKLSIGNEVPIKYTCGGCRTSVEFDYSLDLQECKFPETTPPNLSIPLELKRGFIITRDEIYKDVVLTYLKGRDQESIVQMAQINPGKAALSGIYASIKDIPGFDMSKKNPMLVDNLRSVDMDIINKGLEESRLGPSLLADSICGTCERVTQIPLVGIMFSTMG